MGDERVIAVKLEQYHGELKQKQETRSREEFLRSTTDQRAVERMFENARQACSALAQHIATRAFGFEGQTAKEAVRALHEEGVIDEQPMTTIVSAIGVRNVLAHEYGHVDVSKVYETLHTGLSVYDAYSQQVAQWAREWLSSTHD